jgi:hypothetical protein
VICTGTIQSDIVNAAAFGRRTVLVTASSLLVVRGFGSQAQKR